MTADEQPFADLEATLKKSASALRGAGSRSCSAAASPRGRAAARRRATTST